MELPFGGVWKNYFSKLQVVAYTVKSLINGARHSPLGPTLGTRRFWGHVAVANPHPRSAGPHKVTAPNSDPLQTLLWPWNLHREAQVLGTHCTCPSPPLYPLGSGLDSWNWCTPAGGSYGMALLWSNKWLESRGCRLPPRCPLTLGLAFSHPQVSADIDATRKLQTNVPHEHCYKHPQKNASTIETSVKNTRLVSLMKINHMDRIKEKNNRIISIRAEKSFDKISHPFLI